MAAALPAAVAIIPLVSRVRDDDSWEVEEELGGETEAEARPCVGVRLDPRVCMKRIGESTLVAGEEGLLVGSKTGAAGFSAPTPAFNERVVERLEFMLLWNPTARTGDAILCTLEFGLW